MTDEIIVESVNSYKNFIGAPVMDDDALSRIARGIFEDVRKNKKTLSSPNDFYLEVHQFCEKESIYLPEDASQEINVIKFYYAQEDQFHQSKKIINKLIEDKELLETAEQLFESFKINDKKNIFFALDEFDLAVRSFGLKNGIEPGSDGLSLVVNVLFYRYSQLDNETILLNIKKRIEKNCSQTGNDRQDETEKNHFMYNYADSTYKNIFPVLETISASTKIKQLTHEENYKETEPLIDNYMEEKMASMVQVLTHFNALVGTVYFSGDRQEERSVDETLASFEKAFTRQEEAEISKIFQESFASMREIISARPDYKRMKNFSETVKKIVWFLSAYLIAYPKATFKHSRQEILEKLLENIYAIFDSASTFLPSEKIKEIEKLLNGFLPKAGKKTLASIIKYSLASLENVKKEFEQEPQYHDAFIIVHQNERSVKLCDKSILNYKYTLKMNDIINGESYLKDLATVPFAHIKKERKKFRDAFVNSSIIRQFFQFLASFFKKNDEILMVFNKEKLLEKMPAEILGDVKLSGKIAKEALSRKRIYHFFKVAKIEASKKVKKAKKGLKKQIISANNRVDFVLPESPKGKKIANDGGSPGGSPSERGRAPSRLGNEDRNYMLARDFVPYDIGGPLL